MTKTTSYVVTGIDSSVADELRARGGINYVADEQPGFPCRQCLRDAEIGDEMILVSHDPFTGWSPYRSASPIFLHRWPCAPSPDDAQLPEQLTRRRLSVRAFDMSEMMLDAALIDGADLGATSSGSSRTRRSTTSTSTTSHVAVSPLVSNGRPPRPSEWCPPGVSNPEPTD
jgi:hypothetical protein